ncbi:MAG: hypothetical protein KDC48_19305, partial [Planctomycetes bacterium]|nr:hypothetical protein [Planctomycetota bacterium]
MTSARLLLRRRTATAALPILLVAFACSRGGGGTGDGTIDTTTHPTLAAVHYGRLVDVYGLSTDAGQVVKVLYQRDVVIGGDIDDERPTGSLTGDFEITYDFDGTDPDTLQPRLFIPRDVDSDEFRTAFDALDDQLRAVTPMRYGEAASGQPFSVVPRNAALRLSFTARLDVDDEFFVGRDAQGRVDQLRNTEAVQLLRIDGDPEAPNAFVPLPVRVVVREREIVLDPVLLGSEGLQYQTQNRAAGMPPSPDQPGANIRIALALEGPLAMPGLRESSERGITGRNNSGRQAIVRDFRSGNAADESADIIGGFARDPLPLRILGELPMLLERVDDVNAFTQEVTVYKNGLSHEIDRGDVLRFVADSSGIPVGSGEVVVDPDDDRGDPAVQHVRVRIRRVPGLTEIDPRNLPGYPSAIGEREAWLVQNAPRAVCVAEFTAGDADGRDEPRNFLTFTPQPLRFDGYIWRPEEFVSPLAGAVVRFTKPVDMSTVRAFDTFFFATRDLTTPESIADFLADTPTNQNGTGIDEAWFDEAKYRTPYLITARVYDEDGSQTALRLQPSPGFYLDDRMRAAPPEQFRYFLHLISSSPDGGVRDLAGNR